MTTPTKQNTEKIINTLLDYHAQLIAAQNMNTKLVGVEFKKNVINVSLDRLNKFKERVIRLIDLQEHIYEPPPHVQPQRSY